MYNVSNLKSKLCLGTNKPLSSLQNIKTFKNNLLPKCLILEEFCFIFL